MQKERKQEKNRKREREKEREKERERERKCVCVCVCVCEREREKHFAKKLLVRTSSCFEKGFMLNEKGTHITGKRKNFSPLRIKSTFSF